MSLALRSTSAVCLVSLLAAANCGKQSPAAPEPSPTPTPAAAATPTPAPTPVVARLACGVGAGTPWTSDEDCPRLSPSFLAQVGAAINRVGTKHPQLFDFDAVRGTDGWFVRNVDEYYRQVVQELGNVGLCAIVDGGGEIAVKASNQFSDQYHIMISSGHVRRGEASYRATCAPAWF